MTRNQQEEMEKEFEKYLNFDHHGDGRATRKNYLSSSSQTFVKLGFVYAYTLQQEKIEKLEKLCGVHFNENGMHEIESYEKQIESLKSDLDKTTNLLKLTTEDSESYDDAVRIRLRHGLTNE